MAVQLITYDLHKPGQHYSELFKAIKALGAWCHCVESVWLVRTNLTTAQVRDALLAHIDTNDVLVVTALAGNWAASHLDDERLNWLRTNLAA